MEDRLPVTSDQGFSKHVARIDFNETQAKLIVRERATCLAINWLTHVIVF